MLKPEDLWIGDLLRSKLTGRTGKYAGMHASGKLKMISGDKTYLLSIKSIEKIDDEIQDTVLDIPELDQISETREFKDEIDLHIEKIRSDLVNALPERILDIQLQTFHDFFESIKRRKLKRALVIHGRGEGVLRQAVRQILASDKNVFQYYSVHNDGATEIILY